MTITTKEEFRICVDECNGKNPTRHKITKNDLKISIMECLVCGVFMTTLTTN